MEIPNTDDTLPIPIQQDPTLPESGAETRPTPVAEIPPSAPELGVTVPTPIRTLDETAPSPVPPLHPEQMGQPPFPPTPGEPPNAPQPPAPRRLPLRAWSALGLVVLIVVAAISAFSGYGSGIRQRKNAESTQAALVIDEQFLLGVQNLEAHQYDLARQRFEYVIQINPGYPGVTDKLADALMYINTTATPTVKPTPTVTPTPDLRGVTELFSQAQQDLSNYEWSKAIDTLLSLRKADQNYQAVWVDDMLYVSFRNRGKDKILKDGDLEGGIYDLTVAEQFGPLDTDAEGLQTWSQLYITGASFWEIDWAQAIFYFGQVAPALPNLRDGSGWTATERYRLALIGYGGYLSDQKEWCAAVEQYELSLTYGSDPQAEAGLTLALEQCSGGDDEPDQPASEESSTPTETPAATGVAPTEVPPTEVPPTEAPPPTEVPPTEPPATEPPAETPTPSP